MKHNERSSVCPSCTSLECGRRLKHLERENKGLTAVCFTMTTRRPLNLSHWSFKIFAPHFCSLKTIITLRYGRRALNNNQSHANTLLTHTRTVIINTLAQKHHVTARCFAPPAVFSYQVFSLPSLHLLPCSLRLFFFPPKKSRAAQKCSISRCNLSRASIRFFFAPLKLSHRNKDQTVEPSVEREGDLRFDSRRREEI